MPGAEGEGRHNETRSGSMQRGIQSISLAMNPVRLENTRIPNTNELKPQKTPLCKTLITLYNRPLNAPVAQLDRVPGYEPGGRAFESLQARQIQSLPQ